MQKQVWIGKFSKSRAHLLQLPAATKGTSVYIYHCNQRSSEGALAIQSVTEIVDAVGVGGSILPGIEGGSKSYWSMSYLGVSITYWIYNLRGREDAFSSHLPNNSSVSKVVRECDISSGICIDNTKILSLALCLSKSHLTAAISAGNLDLYLYSKVVSCRAEGQCINAARFFISVDMSQAISEFQQVDVTNLQQNAICNTMRYQNVSNIGIYGKKKNGLEYGVSAIGESNTASVSVVALSDLSDRIRSHSGHKFFLKEIYQSEEGVVLVYLGNCNFMAGDLILSVHFTSCLSASCLSASGQQWEHGLGEKSNQARSNVVYTANSTVLLHSLLAGGGNDCPGKRLLGRTMVQVTVSVL